VRCLDDGTIEGPAEADVGSVAGIGYPRWTGGVLSYVETVGLASFIAASERLARLHGERFEAPQSLRERAHGDRKFHDTVTQENRP
jgi:3-hydroxyacyl-CoA dehydrogenase/enoyl-CoA hydratase/3-hydroxybutyryl-CoA epimerase